MLERLYGFACDVSVFVICAEMMIHLRAKEKYEKYLKVCLALMLAGMVLGHFSRLPQTTFAETETNAIEEKLKNLNEEEMEQAVDLFWERLLFEERNRESLTDAGEGKEVDDQG